jgi:hypothetical protein
MDRQQHKEPAIFRHAGNRAKSPWVASAGTARLSKDTKFVPKISVTDPLPWKKEILDVGAPCAALHDSGDVTAKARDLTAHVPCGGEIGDDAAETPRIMPCESGRREFHLRNRANSFQTQIVDVGGACAHQYERPE